MKPPTPHYLLFSEASGADGSGRWRFLLHSADGSEQFEAADVEPDVQGERLHLLTIVRALESLDQPSRVTLVGCSRHVHQGMQYGLAEWRNNGWRWEFFGQLVPVKNGDLWQRMDRVLRFHQVECCRRRFDPPHGPLRGPEEVRGEGNGGNGGPSVRQDFLADEWVAGGQPQAAPSAPLGARRPTLRVGARRPRPPQAPDCQKDLPHGGPMRIRLSGRSGLRYRMWPRPVRRRRWISTLLWRWRRRVMRSWTAPKPNPWSG